MFVFYYYIQLYVSFQNMWLMMMMISTYLCFPLSLSQ